MRCAANILVIVAALLVAAPSTAVPEATVRDVEVEGTTFQVTLTDGRVLAQDELVGVRLVLGDGSRRQRQIRIEP
jgi:hypothetical protein